MSDAPGEKSSHARGWCVHIGENVSVCAPALLSWLIHGFGFSVWGFSGTHIVAGPVESVKNL